MNMHVCFAKNFITKFLKLDSCIVNFKAKPCICFLIILNFQLSDFVGNFKLPNFANFCFVLELELFQMQVFALAFQLFDSAHV